MDIDLVNHNLAKANLDKMKKQTSNLARNIIKEKELKGHVPDLKPSS